MERLTMDNGLCQMASTEFCLSQKDCYSCPHGRKSFKRLAAYEDAMPLERARELAQAEKDGRELRDYILESLAKGVLVLTDDASCEVLELPPLGGVMVTLTEQVMPAVERPDLAAETGRPIVEAGPEQKMVGLMGPKAGEKRVIMEKLKAYRRKYGLGHWPEVVKASGGKLTDDQLRDMCAGTAVLPIGEWRLADKALDTIYEKEAENG